MIVDSLASIKHHPGLDAEFLTALEQVMALDLFELAPGDYSLGAGKILVKMMDRQLTAPAVKPFEMHQRDIDIHIPLNGPETLGYVCGDARMENITPYDKAKDICFAQAQQGEAWLVLPPGGLVIFFPGEWHKPACYLDSTHFLRKAVIKIAAPGRY